jgi:hypothetical protein
MLWNVGGFVQSPELAENTHYFGNRYLLKVQPPISSMRPDWPSTFTRTSRPSLFAWAV